MYEDSSLLLIMRHAKSDRTETLMDDFNRPLDERGKLQARLIADQLNNLKISADKVLVSPSKRTRDTWELLSFHLLNPSDAIFEASLYNASCEDFINVIAKHAANCRHLMVIGHCPSVVEVTEFFTGEYHDWKTADLAILCCKKANLVESANYSNSFRFERMLSADIL